MTDQQDAPDELEEILKQYRNFWISPHATEGILNTEDAVAAIQQTYIKRADIREKILALPSMGHVGFDGIRKQYVAIPDVLAALRGEGRG